MNKNISKEDLKKIDDHHNELKDGYRIVYFYQNGRYDIGSYATEIKDFMYDFIKVSPIEDESDIPPFVSINNLLDEYLNNLPEIEGVAIYKITGEFIKSKKRITLNLELQVFLVELIVKIYNNQLTNEEIENIDVDNDSLMYYISKIKTNVFDKNTSIKKIIDKYRKLDDIKLIIDIELVKKYLPECCQLIEYTKLPCEDSKIKELVYLNEEILYLLPDRIKDMFFMYDVLKNDYKVAMVIDHFDKKNKKYYFLNNDLYNLYIDGLIKLIHDDINNYDLLSEEAKLKINEKGEKINEK